MALDDSRAFPRASLDAFWARLHELEDRHREARRLHEQARRRLEATRTAPDDELRQCWAAYCESIAGLDDATSELELFRGGAIQAFAD
jgi:hypothetical protein